MPTHYYSLLRLLSRFWRRPWPWRKTPRPLPLKDELEAQYKLAKIAYSSGGATITEPGTVLVTQKGGILGSRGNLTLCSATFKDGSLNPTGRIAPHMCGKNARQLPSGEKVYVTKIDVNPKKDKVSLRIIECDSCNGALSGLLLKSDVFFEFPKGSLANPSVHHRRHHRQGVRRRSLGAYARAQGAAAKTGPKRRSICERPRQCPGPTPPAQIQLGQSTDEVVGPLSASRRKSSIWVRRRFTSTRI